MVVSNIADIVVYDPMSDGIDWEIYQKRYWEAHARSVEEAYAINDGLYDKVSASLVGKGLTLEEFMVGKGGYLTHDKEGTAVVFVNGRFHSEYHGVEMYSVDLEKLGKEMNAIPFEFFWLPETTSQA